MRGEQDSGGAEREPGSALAWGRPVAGTRPQLTPAQMERMRSYGAMETIAVGDAIYQLGDDSYDLIFIESGRVDLVRDDGRSAEPLVIADMAAGDFLGEISLYTGERMFLIARVREAGVIYRIGAEAFRQLMSRDTELSDVILTALYQRRDVLKVALAGTIEIVDHHNSADVMPLVTYAERMELPYRFSDALSPRGAALMTSLDLRPDDLPAVLTPEGLLRRRNPR